MRSVSRDRGGVDGDKRGVDYAELIKSFYLRRHEFLKLVVMEIFDKAFKHMISRELFRNIETAIVSYDQIVVEVIPQIGDIFKAFTLHDDD